MGVRNQIGGRLQGTRLHTGAPQTPITRSNQREKKSEAWKTLVREKLKINAVRTAGQKSQWQGSRLIALEDIDVWQNVKRTTGDRIIMSKIPSGSPGDEALLRGIIEVSA